jgi:hypothetical protein
MATLVNPSELKTFVNTPLSDDAVQRVLDAVEYELNRRIGEPQNNDGDLELTETLEGGRPFLFLKHPISEVVEITETSWGGTETILDADDYRVWGEQGKLERQLARSWATLVTVTYVPTDDRPVRRQAIIDLARIALDRQAMKAESIGGEYSYTAPDWEAEKEVIYRRLEFPRL